MFLRWVFVCLSAWQSQHDIAGAESAVQSCDRCGRGGVGRGVARTSALPARPPLHVDGCKGGLKVVMSMLLLCVVDDDARIRFEIMCIVPVLIACLIRHRFRVQLHVDAARR